jgi:hypothetical protein
MVDRTFEAGTITILCTALVSVQSTTSCVLADPELIVWCIAIAIRANVRGASGFLDAADVHIHI